jgi:small subunit ribosomal protein S20
LRVTGVEETRICASLRGKSGILGRFCGKLGFVNSFADFGCYTRPKIVSNSFRKKTDFMPQHKGAVRRVRLSEKRRIANKGKKVDMRKLMKAFDPASATAATDVKKIQSTLDRMARTGVVKKNFASNKKAKLMRSIKKATA